MLIDFTVSNFRSFGEEVTFSMVASSDSSLRDNVIDDPDLLRQSRMSLLRSAVVFGGNASGKSNLCRALHTMRRLVINSATDLSEGDEIPEIAPFRLCQSTETSPSKFEVRILLEGNVYRYGFEATSKEFVREWLWVTRAAPGSRESKIFVREGRDRDNWQLEFKGKGALRRTPPHHLIISKAPRESVDALTPIYRWFRHKLRAVNMEETQYRRYEFEAVTKFHEGGAHSWAKRLFAVADPGVVNVDTEVRKEQLSEEARRAFAAYSGADDVPSEIEITDLSVLREQYDTGKLIPFELQEESSGTRKFFVIGQMLLEAMRDGALVIMDEMESSLHPWLTREVISVLNAPDINVNGAQFLLTTHNIDVLNFRMMRRDQIFLVDKNPLGISELFAVNDLEPMPKTDMNAARQYLAGRFGGVPTIGNLRAAIAAALTE